MYYTYIYICLYLNLQTINDLHFNLSIHTPYTAPHKYNTISLLLWLYSYKAVISCCSSLFAIVTPSLLFVLPFICVENAISHIFVYTCNTCTHSAFHFILVPYNYVLLHSPQFVSVGQQCVVSLCYFRYFRKVVEDGPQRLPPFAIPGRITTD